MIEFGNSIYTIDEFEIKNANVKVTATYVGEKEMYSNWFGHWSLPSEYCIKTREAKNCDIIEKKLNDEGLNVYVYRHTIFDIKCYVVTERSEGSETFFDEDLAEILDIPKEWINLSRASDPHGYYILEDEFNEKYCNKDGLVEFKPDLQKYWNKCNIGGIKKYFAEQFHIPIDDVYVHWIGGEFVEIKLPKHSSSYTVDFLYTSLHNDENVIIIKKEWL